jgi:sugar O-acyltransferase (sialic acid O-acetyltransferase NeuD family)
MDVIILGAGSTAQLAVSILSHDRNLKVVGCVDVLWPEDGRRVLDVPIVGDHSVLAALQARGVRGALVAVSDNRIRERHFYMLERLGYELVNAVHPSTVIGAGVRLGRGVCVAEGCVLSAGVSVDDNVILDAGAVVGSHAVIGPNVYLGNGSVVGSGATIGRNCFLDVGVAVARQVSVGKHNRIAAGSSLHEDVPDQLATTLVD